MLEVNIESKEKDLVQIGSLDPGDLFLYCDSLFILTYRGCDYLDSIRIDNRQMYTMHKTQQVDTNIDVEINVKRK